MTDFDKLYDQWNIKILHLYISAYFQCNDKGKVILVLKHQVHI